jgi:uncharacterized protein
MLEILKQPWAWYIAGPMIGLTVPILLILGNKAFGLSSSLRHICAACIPANIPFFKYDWKKETWNLMFVFGIFLGGAIAAFTLKNPNPIALNPQTISDLQNLGIKDFNHFMPIDIFGTAQIFTLKGFIFMVFGGFLVGFGTRYAGGCTSGHAIMGLSNFQLPSLIATICFMVGGFLSTHLLLPLLLNLVQ